MTDQSVGDRAGRTVAPGFGQVEDPSRDKRHNRRALWISVVAIGTVTAVAIPIGLHLAHRSVPQLQLPDALAGLTRDTSSDAADTADYLRSAVAAGLDLDRSVGAVYTDGSTGTAAAAHSVIFIGGSTTAHVSDATLLGKAVGLLNDSTDGIADLTTEDAGTLGGLLRCGLTTDTSTPAPATADSEMAVCAFADGGSIGIGLFPNRTVPLAADLMRTMRTAIQ